MTIRTRLALWYTGLLTLIIIIFSVTVFTVMQVSILSTIDNVLSRTASEVIRGMGVTPVGPVGMLSAQITFRSDDIFLAPGTSIQVWQTHTGTSTIDSPVLARASSNLIGFTEPLDAASVHSTAERYTNVSVNDIAGRVATRPFYSAGQQIGVVQVATSIQTVEQSSEMLLLVMFIATVISVVAAVILSLWFSGRALQPIDDIAQAAANIARADDLSTRMSWDGPMDELGRLSSVFNHMMGRLEHLFSVQQRFVGDVSHELRTPLTAIKGNVEIIRRYGMDASALDAIHSETERMSRMVNDLLLLARAEYGEIRVDFEPMHLDRLALQVYEQSQMLITDRQLRLKLGRMEPTQMHGNTDRIKQLIINLINNAIKFTPDGGQIEVSVFTDKEQAVLEVSDTGIGIGQDDQACIFDRFFQADNSRVHRSDNDGAGLGLSIVKAFVDLHRGSVAVNSTPGSGTTFTVRLPPHDPP